MSDDSARDETPAMPGTTPRLNAALAMFQAELPKITKGETGEVKGVTEAGKPYSYDYRYAGLDAVSEAALPLLGRNGLAFTAWPTLADGKFVLLYELLHESGESKSGAMPLPASGKPQQLGGLLTYYRRYALCAVTGIAPAGEDNDAADANHPQQYDRPQSASEAFATAAPAAKRAERVAATPADDPWYAPAADSAPAAADGAPVTDQAWLGDMLTRAATFTARDAGQALWKETGAVLRSGACTKADADQIAEVLKARHGELAAAAAGVADAPDPWAEKVADCISPDDCAAALADLEVQAKNGRIDGREASVIRHALQAKSASLEKASAA